MLDAVCAGHICLDLTPTFTGRLASWNDMFSPGRMTEVGPLQFDAGGSVANTGIALTRLGMETALMTKVGSDSLGMLTADALEKEGGDGSHLVVSEGETSAYSVVIAVPGEPAFFLHDAAVNRTFGIDDIDYDVVADSRLFHLGYATMLDRLYEDNGRMLVEVLKRAKEAGATTSLDTAMPDPSSENARVDWDRVIAACLPYTDIFCPSLEELLFMTDPSEYYRLQSMNPDVLVHADMDQVSAMGARMVGMGAKIVLIKCGYLGCYLKTAPASDMRDMGRGAPADPAAWAGREMFSAPFRVREVQSRIGAGCVTIAGFLAGVLRGLDARDCLELAAAAGSYSVSSQSAIAPVVSADEMLERIRAGWQKENINYTGRRLMYHPETRIYGE